MDRAGLREGGDVVAGSTCRGEVGFEGVEDGAAQFGVDVDLADSGRAGAREILTRKSGGAVQDQRDGREVPDPGQPGPVDQPAAFVVAVDVADCDCQEVAVGEVDEFGDFIRVCHAGSVGVDVDGAVLVSDDAAEFGLDRDIGACHVADHPDEGGVVLGWHLGSVG